MTKVVIIGAGLAGAECANTLSKNGIEVVLYEMKPRKFSPAHKNPGFAELVCSNSLKSDMPDTASGTLKTEMRVLGSVTLEAAEKCKVLAGGALAVDREKFSEIITEELKNRGNITVKNEVVAKIPEEGDYIVIATGPLTDSALVPELEKLCGKGLSFFDAAAPIVSAESVDNSIAYLKSRYDKGEPDYLNCPFTKEEYYAFVKELLGAERAKLHDFETQEVFEGCMPVEIMAARGDDTLRFGPLKPVGLRNPVTGERPFAVLQLRAENADRTMYNLVGFQTNLTFPEQKRVFSMIPGLANAEFLKYGVMHRNTYVNASKCLNPDFSVKADRRVYIAGQLSGVEGYMESAASGIMCAYSILQRIKGSEVEFPLDTVCGALSHFICSEREDVQPMNANFGILPELENPPRAKAERKKAYSERAEKSMREYLSSLK